MSGPGCEATRRLIPAYVDDELVGEERTSFHAHIAGCEACRRVLREEQALARALGIALPPTRAPERLRAQVESLHDAQARRRPLRKRWPLAAALALAAGMGAYVLGRHAAASPPAPTAVKVAPPGDLAALAADTHLRYTRGQLPLEIGSAKPEEVSRWFAGRVPFNLALPDYPVGPGEQKFYRLQGGRLVAFGGDYAAYVAYRMEDRPISLIVTSAGLARPEGADTVRFRSLVFHQEAVRGLKVVTWTDKGLTYALASDLSVSGEQSCMVCHGSPKDRALIRGFAAQPAS